MLNPHFSGPEGSVFAVQGSCGKVWGAAWRGLQLPRSRLHLGQWPGCVTGGLAPAPAGVSSGTIRPPGVAGTSVAGTVLAGSGLRAGAPREVWGRPRAGR